MEKECYTEEFINNKQLNESEIANGKIVLDSLPRILMMVLTTRCNLECIMCSRGNPRRDLTIASEKVKQIATLFPYLEAIDWQGGEVFLVDYFKDLFIEASRFPNIDQSIVTNGLLINDEWLDVLINSRVNLTFSIDSVEKKTYEYIRRGARFEALLDNLKALRAVNIKNDNPIQLHLNAVVMRSNYKELYLFPGFCQDYGIKHLRFDFLRPDVAKDEDVLIKSDADAVEYLNNILPKIEDECSKSGIWFEYTLRPFLASTNVLSGGPAAKKQPVRCKLPWKKIFIDASRDGAARPDCLCEHSIGNINTDSIEEIWNSKVMQSYRQRLVDGNIHDWCSRACISHAVDTYQLEGGNY